MANIRKRGNTYQIRISCGYDVRGVQQFQSKTWKPDEGMTPKQIEKELNRQAILFEEECKKGQVTASVKFETLAEEWFEQYATALINVLYSDAFCPQCSKAITIPYKQIKIKYGFKIALFNSFFITFSCC